MLALHTGRTPGCSWTATTFHLLTAMNYSYTTCSGSHTHKYMHSHKHTQARTHAWRHESHSGHMEGSALTYLIKYDHCTCAHTHTHTCLLITQCSSSKTQDICSIYYVGKHRETQFSCKNVHKPV